MTNREDGLRVVVVGGGISGLATAWYLEKEAAARGLPGLVCTVLEKSGRLGGKVRTETVSTEAGRFVVEAGPDSFLAVQKPWALELAAELGLSGRLLGTNDEARRIYVLSRGRPVRMPEGVMLLVPTKLSPFLLSPLISPLGKLRMGLDLVIPRRGGDEDEALGDFVARRMGAEALDKIAEPLLSGIYSAEVARQSLLATLPRFREMERKHGSLIRAMLAERRNGPRGESGHERPTSMFTSFQGGTQELVGGLLNGLKAEVRTDARVVALTPDASHGYAVRVVGDAGSPVGAETIRADAVVLAVPAYVAAELLDAISPAAAALRSIRYVSTGTVSLAYREDASWSSALKRLRGFGVLVPASEKRPINAITWSSTKFRQRAPGGHSLLRVFFGGSRSPHSMDLEDGELLDVVRGELREIMGITNTPLFHRIYRCEKGNPQYDVGHLERVETVKNGLPPNVWVTGSPYRGIGLPDCVLQARETATRVLSELNSGRGGRS